MTLWTQKRIRNLRKASEESLSRIQRLVDDTALEKPSAGMSAWGQFLDAPRNVEQYGLFGTAAAISVLLRSGFAQENPKILKSRTWLPEIEPSSPALGLDDTDVGLTLKCAAVLSAAEVDSEGDYARQEDMERRLIAAIVEGKGWGDFSYAGNADTTARILPTAHALLALEPSRTFRTSKECVAILGWLSHSVIQRQDLPAHELAMAALALQAYQAAGLGVSEYAEAVNTATRRLTRWAKDRSSTLGADVNSYHYTAPTGPGMSQHTHYMFYLPDILVARHFLCLGEVPEGVRGYVLEIVKGVTENVKENGGFKSASSHQVSTVDQMEVQSLLVVFSRRSEEPGALLPRAMRIVSETRARRVLTTVLLLVVGLAASIPLTVEDAPGWLKVSGSVVAALATGILAALWISWSGAG